MNRKGGSILLTVTEMWTTTTMKCPYATIRLTEKKRSGNVSKKRSRKFAEMQEICMNAEQRDQESENMR